MKKPRITRKIVGWILGAVVIVGLVVFAGVLVNSDHGAVTTTKLAMCNAHAAEQLPPAVVKTVESNQRMFSIPASGGSRVLASREIDENWSAEAFVSFMPQYCGYIGNINDFPTSEAARRGKTNPSGDEMLRDKVIVIKNGVQMTEYDSNICIGDSPPTARHLSNGAIEMTLYCDRSYGSDTWMQKSPKLTPIT